MAHRSKLSQIVIDCADLDAGRAFWAGALGLPAAAATIEEPYAILGDVGGLHIVVQRVPEPKTAKSRVHLDIETDDIEAEVRRLEALGARRVDQHEGWWVMHDPCGNEFCVFGPQLSADFPAGTRAWDEYDGGSSSVMPGPVVTGTGVCATMGATRRTDPVACGGRGGGNRWTSRMRAVGRSTPS